MYEHLIEFYNSHPHSMKYHENSPECIEIRQLTSFLDESGLFSKIGYKQRIWHIKNNDFNIRVCPICGNPVKFCHKEYVITCSKKCHKEYFNSDIRRNKFKETCLRKYGVENFSKSKEFVQKSKETSLRKYGTEYYQQTEEYKERAKETCLEKYGTEYYNQTEESKKRTRKTNLRKYGTEYYQQTEESKKRVRKTWEEKSQKELDDIKEKSQKTCLKKYGVSAYSKTDEFKQDYKETCLRKYNVDNTAKVPEFKDRARETCLQRYGVEYYLQTEDCKEKLKSTCLQRYGVDNPLKSHMVRGKAKETCLQRYGAEYYPQAEESKQKLNSLFLEKLKNDNYYELGYRLIGYKGNGNYELYCPNCNRNFMINCTDHFYHRNKLNQEICTYCNPLLKHYSCGEKEIVDYIKSIYNKEVIENDRSIIHPYELDIYLPDLRLAIEYNGDYWHANPKFYDANDVIIRKTVSQIWKKDEQKINRCIKVGIELLVIWEDDWTNRQDVVKQELLDIIIELLEKRISC